VILPEVYQSPDGSGLAVETSDGEFIELGRNTLGSWDKQGMIEVIPDSWVRLVPETKSDNPQEAALALWAEIRGTPVEAELRMLSDAVWYALEDDRLMADPAVQTGLEAMRRGEVTEA
jgi:hypothetical protein